MKVQESIHFVFGTRIQRICMISSSPLSKLVFAILPLLLLLACNKVPDYTLSKENPEVSKSREATLISAFFGLDNAMPKKSVGLWSKAPGQDGMPLVFSHEIDPSTLNPDFFEVTTQKGQKMTVAFATFRPAIEEFELRTVLLIGEFGNAPDNEPDSIEIIGDLKTRDGQNLKGQKAGVTRLTEGPFISYAEYFDLDENYPYLETGKGCDCPKSQTRKVVRVVWSGGVRATNGEELGNAELNAFTVTLLRNTDTIRVHPFQMADLNDNENNIDLCIREEGIPLYVEAAANIAIDPRDDKNANTKCKVAGRWE